MASHGRAAPALGPWFRGQGRAAGSPAGCSRPGRSPLLGPPPLAAGWRQKNTRKNMGIQALGAANARVIAAAWALSRAASTQRPFAEALRPVRAVTTVSFRVSPLRRETETKRSLLRATKRRTKRFLSFAGNDLRENRFASFRNIVSRETALTVSRNDFLIRLCIIKEKANFFRLKRRFYRLVVLG